MFSLVLNSTWENYKSNIKVAVSYLLLLVFIFVFTYFGEFFFNSGTVFLNLRFSTFTIVGLILGLIFLYAYSFFVSLTIYAIKRDLHTTSFDDYWEKIFKGAAVNVFVSNFIITLVSLAFFLIATYFTLPIIYPILFSFILTLTLMYVPQVIVLEELDVFSAFGVALNFFLEKIWLSILITIFASVILFIIILLEQLLYGFFLANFVSLILILVFLIPFIEEAKAFAYMMRFDLIKNPAIHHSKVRHKVKAKIDAFRLRQKNPRGKL